MKKENIMKKLTLLLTALILVGATPVYAGHHEGEKHETKTEAVVQSGDVHVSVNGLVCDFCARALEKTFGKQETVEGIDVNLESKVVTINFNDGQTLDDETITKLITDAGYNVEGIHRVK